METLNDGYFVSIIIVAFHLQPRLCICDIKFFKVLYKGEGSGLLEFDWIILIFVDAYWLDVPSFRCYTFISSDPCYFFCMLYIRSS